MPLKRLAQNARMLKSTMKSTRSLRNATQNQVSPPFPFRPLPRHSVTNFSTRVSTVVSSRLGLGWRLRLTNICSRASRCPFPLDLTPLDLPQNNIVSLTRRNNDLTLEYLASFLHTVVVYSRIPRPQLQIIKRHMTPNILLPPIFMFRRIVIP